MSFVVPLLLCLLSLCGVSMLLVTSAASLALPGQDLDDLSAASLAQRALERQALYDDLATEMQRTGLLLGHEILGGIYTQSQLFDKVSKPGHWKKPTVKAKLHHLEVRKEGRCAWFRDSVNVQLGLNSTSLRPLQDPLHQK